MKRRTDCPQENEKKLLKQRLDFPFDQRIETMDRLLTVQGKQSVETTVRYFTQELKQPKDCLQCKAKKLLKERLDFPFEKRIETTDRLPTRRSQNSVKITVRFHI